MVEQRLEELKDKLLQRTIDQGSFTIHLRRSVG